MGGSSSEQHTHHPTSPITEGFLTEKENQQLLLDEEALRETLTEQARAEKEWEEKIMKERAQDELSRQEIFAQPVASRVARARMKATAKEVSYTNQGHEPLSWLARANIALDGGRGITRLATGNTLAWTVACERDQWGRAIAGHVNVAQCHLIAEQETLLSATLIHEASYSFYLPLMPLHIKEMKEKGGGLRWYHMMAGTVAGNSSAYA
nr:leishmanolysin-like peptidase [Tanacetum cinerariifolium]